MCYCTVFALFYFEFEGNFQVQAPGCLYSEGRFNIGFFALRVCGLIFGAAYFRNFTVVATLSLRGVARLILLKHRGIY